MECHVPDETELARQSDILHRQALVEGTRFDPLNLVLHEALFHPFTSGKCILLYHPDGGIYNDMFNIKWRLLVIETKVSVGIGSDIRHAFNGWIIDTEKQSFFCVPRFRNSAGADFLDGNIRPTDFELKLPTPTVVEDYPGVNYQPFLR